jgi:glycogen debranching enzyme
MDDFAVEPLLSDQGWAYASQPPVDAGDPGRFHALFGRDSLIFALQVLPSHPQVAVDTLRAHARLQGQRTDPETDEQPGKIIHEYWADAPRRLADAGWPVRGGELRYWGTADATSWFLIVLAAASCLVTSAPPGSAPAGPGAMAGPDLIAELSGSWQAAGRWLENALEAGAGFVRYGRPARYSGGLSQQGWRDASDPAANPHGGGIVRSDGSQPAQPLADADCQAAAVAALSALAVIDPGRAGHWQELRAGLVARISARFGPEVMALEPVGTQDVVVPGAGSQLGWLLWADALEPSARAAVADRLTRDDVLTGYGLRTLSARHLAFFPQGYHRGAVWPFDSWLGWGGLRAAGHVEQAGQVRDGVLDALRRLGRAPELYAVTTSGRLEPVAASNRVQAWTVGAARALRAGWDGRPGAGTG